MKNKCVCVNISIVGLKQMTTPSIFFPLPICGTHAQTIFFYFVLIWIHHLSLYPCRLFLRQSQTLAIDQTLITTQTHLVAVIQNTVIIISELTSSPNHTKFSKLKVFLLCRWWKCEQGRVGDKVDMQVRGHSSLRQLRVASYESIRKRHTDSRCGARTPV